MIPIYEINSVKYNHPDLFDLNPEERLYIHSKNTFYDDLIHTHLKLNNDNTKTIVTSLRSNCYSDALLHATNEDMLNQIREFKDYEL